MTINHVIPSAKNAGPKTGSYGYNQKHQYNSEETVTVNIGYVTATELILVVYVT